jgi:hypothetical protein
MAESGSDRKFSVSDVVNSRVEKYKPELIGVGGLQLVYQLPDFPDNVIKVGGFEVLAAIEAGYDTYLSAKDLEEKVETENARIKNLSAYFGADHVLDQSHHLLKVPINRRIVSEIFKSFSRGLNIDPGVTDFSGNYIWSVVTVQQKCRELSDPKRLSVVAGYAEKRLTHPSYFRNVYGKVTSESVFNLNSMNSINFMDLTAVQTYLAFLVEEVSENEGLRHALQDFTRRAIKYTNKTGEILDLAGSDNIIVVRDAQGNWNYKITDGLFPSRGRAMVRQAGEYLSLVANGNSGRLDKGDILVLMNTLNYTRTVNGFANIWGIKERINIVPGDATGLDSEVLLNLIGRQFGTVR